MKAPSSRTEALKRIFSSAPWSSFAYSEAVALLARIPLYSLYDD